MSKPTVTVASFDAADFLDNEETIAEFLNAAAEDETPGAFILAVEAVAKARGMAKVAEDSGLSRESLYKALAPDAQPRFDTVRRVLGALGTKLAVVPRNTGFRHRGAAVVAKIQTPTAKRAPASGSIGKRKAATPASKTTARTGTRSRAAASRR
jgi:probable addiction module antidote protein